MRIAQGTLLAEQRPVTVNDQVTEIAVSPDGKDLALVARGDVFVVRQDSGLTRRITATAQAERSVSFSPDGRKLLYASDRQVDWDLFESRIVRPGDTSFVDAAEIEETVLLDSDTDLLQPSYSPKGTWSPIAMAQCAAGADDSHRRDPRGAADSATYSYGEGDQSHDWSPDGTMIATTRGFELGNRDVDVIEIATGKRHNISLNGFNDKSPRFSRDGALVYWHSNRFSLRQLDEQTPLADVVATRLSREAAEVEGAGHRARESHGRFRGRTRPDRADHAGLDDGAVLRPRRRWHGHDRGCALRCRGHCRLRRWT